MNLQPAADQMRKIHTLRLAGENTKHAEAVLSAMCDKILLEYDRVHVIHCGARSGK